MIVYSYMIVSILFQKKPEKNRIMRFPEIMLCLEIENYFIVISYSFLIFRT